LADESLLDREIAGYRIVAVVGEGGMGAVYLADHVRLQRQVALKVLPRKLALDADYRDRFLRESRLAAGLTHPNVVPVHDAGEAEGLLYIAMRFVDGRDLRSLLAEAAPLDPRRALALTAQVAGALDAAHERGLVHRDVKPGNVLVADGDHAYLADFGIAVEFDGSAPGGIVPGEALGTLAYVAPEQIEGGPVDGCADQYALACMLYECLTGRPPFGAERSGLTLLWAHLEEPPPAVTAAVPELPAGLDVVLARGLAKQSGARFSSCGALVDAARAAIEGSAPGALPAALDGPSPPLLGRAGEFDWLRQAWAEARRGGPGLVLISGPRGAGKTRLVAELARNVRGGAGVRYASAVGRDDDAVRVLAPPPAKSRPALVVIEDLDAADEAVLARLEDSIESAPPVLVVGTFRRADTTPLRELTQRVPHLRLDALTAEGVAAIAELYAGTRASELPLESVMQATDGLPGAVHEVVSEWARSAATGRLRVAAGRIEAGRSDLRDAEAAVAEDVQALQLIRDRARIYFPELAQVEARPGAPFKGLASFEQADADRFFGRERLIAELVARLTGSPLLALVGPSGSGKSSVLRAGLLPVLAGGAIPGSERWSQVVLRPGERSAEELLELVRGASADHTLIAVDQFEEVFSSDRPEEDRAAFVGTLVTAAHDPAGRFAVVLALRADLFGRCAEHPALAELLDRHSVLVGPMRPEELRRAIELPATRAGVRVAPELVEALVGDVAGRPGALPLLSTALLELWHARANRALTLRAYQKTGGVGGAVARLAESAYAALDPGEQDATRGVFLRLAQDTAGDGGRAMRRRAPLSEFDLEADQRLRRVLGVLTQRRLVAVGQHGVEVAHEALLQEWPRLREWLLEDAEGRHVRRHLTDAATQWRSGGRDPGDLYRGARLAATLDWARQHGAELNELERAYLADSQAAGERDTRRVRRTNRRLRVLLAGVAVLLAAALAGGLVALVQRGRARNAETSALAGRLGAQALIDEPLERSVLLARQAVALDDSLQTRSSLLGALLRSPAALRVIPGNGNRLLRTAMSPDGSVLAVSDNTRSVLLIDARTFERAAPPLELPGQPWGLQFSPDGRKLAVAYNDPKAGNLQLFDVRTREPGPRRRMPGYEPTGVAFSPGGRTLFVADTAWADGVPNRLLQLDATTLRRRGRAVALPAGIATTHLIAPDRLVVSWVDHDGRNRDGKTALFDARTLERVKTMSPGWESIEFSDGRLAAIPGAEGQITLLDLRSGEARVLPSRHAGGVSGVSFSPDGRTVVSTGEEEVIVSDVASGEPLETLRGHSGRAFDPVFTPDGRTLFTVGLDGTIMAWDPSGARRLGRPFEYGDPSPAPEIEDPSLDPAVSADGRTLIVPTSEGKLTFWRARDLSRAHQPVDLGATMDLARSPDGRTLAASTARGELVLMDVSGTIATRRRVGGKARNPGQVEFAPDGRVLAVATERSVGLFDSATARARGRPLGSPGVVGLAFSPDGTRLALGTGKGVLELWDIATRRRVRRKQILEYGVWGLDYSPDGRLIATGDDDGYLRFFDAATGRQSGRAIKAHDGAVLRTGFSPGGRIVFTSGTDGVASLWDVRSRKQVGAPLPVAPGWVFGRFNDRGSSLLAVSGAGRAVLWSVDPADWKRRACALAGRTLTRPEWATFLPERPYRPACR